MNRRKSIIVSHNSASNHRQGIGQREVNDAMRSSLLNTKLESNEFRGVRVIQ